MWREILRLFKTESLCEESFRACITMLRDCKSMFEDAVRSLRIEGTPGTEIYSRDRMINRFERKVRRNIVTHLAISKNPDVNTALVLTAIVIDIERIGDYTKNIVELAAAHPGPFEGGDLDEEIRQLEETVRSMFEELIPALENTDVDAARRIMGDHQMLADRVEESLQDLISCKVKLRDSGEAVTAALYLRYLKRVSAHLKNVATSIVNPFYRIGYREKPQEPAAE